MTSATSKTKTTPDIDPTANVTESPQDWQWETVAEGSAAVVIFEEIGDTFIGQYIGDEHVEQEPNAKGEDQSFDRFIYRGRDGERYAINKSYALIEAMANVKVNDWTRITFIREIPTKRGLNPLKDFKVDVRK